MEAHFAVNSPSGVRVRGSGRKCPSRGENDAKNRRSARGLICGARCSGEVSLTRAVPAAVVGEGAFTQF